MKKLPTISILAYCLISLLGCSHWTWVFKNEALIREKICTPDSTQQTIITDRLVPYLEVDTEMLRTLNKYETLIISYDDSVNRYRLESNYTDSTIAGLLTFNKKLVNDLRQLAQNQKVHEIIKRVPYPVYIDKLSTLNALIQSQASGARKTKAIWILSFIVAGLVGIIVYLLKRK
jgi:hypothetical protein